VKLRLNNQIWVASFTSILLAAILALSGCQKQQEVASRWTEQPIQVDGHSGDWPSVTGIVLQDENAALSFSNDSTHFYVLFRTRDVGWVRTIQMTGLTLYLDTRGGRSQDFFVRFKGGPTPDQMPDIRGDRGGQVPQMADDRKSRQMQDAAPSFTCFIKDRITEKTIPTDGSEGPAVAFDIEKGFYTYEFSIPLAESRVRSYGLACTPGTKLGLGATWGDLGAKMKESRPGGGGMGGRGDGGTPRGGGGMGRGGMGGPPGGQRPEMPQKQEVWFKTVLATPDSEFEPEVSPVKDDQDYLR
jgi:hypothetical protein